MPLPRLLAQNQLRLFHASAALGLSLIHALHHDGRNHGSYADPAHHDHADDDAVHGDAEHADGAGSDYQ